MEQDDGTLLSGRFGPISIQDLMGFLASVRLSGLLTIEAPEGVLAIYWVDGSVVWSEPLRGGLAADQLLVESDRIPAAELAAVRDSSPDRPIGDALVQTGRITVEQLQEFRVELVSENIYRMFEWALGTFRLEDDHEPPTDVQPMRIEVQGLLLEAAHRYDEWNRLPALYSESGTRFELLAEPKSNESIALSLDEWRMLYLVNSCRNLGDIWAQSEQPDIEVSRTLFGLATARLVRPLQAGEGGGVLGGGLGDSIADGVRFSGAMEVPAGVDPGNPPDTLMLPPKKPEAPTADEDLKTLTGPPSGVKRLSRTQIDVRQVSRLVELVDGGEGQELDLDALPLIIGRAPDNDVVLADKHVSSRHARILADGDHLVLEDLGSSNGVRVDGRRVTRVFLRAGNEIEIYPFRFRIERQVSIEETG